MLVLVLYNGGGANAKESEILDDAEQQKRIRRHYYHKRISPAPIPYAHIQNKDKRIAAVPIPTRSRLSLSVHSGMDETEGGAQTVLEYVGRSGTGCHDEFFAEARRSVEEYKEACHYDWRDHWKAGIAVILSVFYSRIQRS
jgi:hypothetical protein